MRKITLIPGDGIGPEVADATMKVIEATGVKIDWDIQVAGGKMIEKFGSPLPESVLDQLRQMALH